MVVFSKSFFLKLLFIAAGLLVWLVLIQLGF